MNTNNTAAPTKSNYAKMKIGHCMTGCKHDFQDKAYGMGQRAMNPCKSGTAKTAYRCTVCGKVQD